MSSATDAYGRGGPINWSDFIPVGRELEYLNDAFNSGWVSGGAYVEKLEALLESEFVGSKSFAVANGTLALQLAFQALGVRPGDEVVVPAFCFQAAANVLLQLGAKPVFCDVDPLTWNQTTQSLKNAITEKTVGIVVVHNYGASAPVDEIASLAEARGIWLIEDCAEAWFSRYRGRYVGQFGTLATFSMHATKPIACGEGGVVLSRQQGIETKLRLLRSHGLDRSQAHYLHLLAGNNYRLSNLLAAVAVAQMEARSSIVADQASRLRWFAVGLRAHSAFQLQHALSDADDNIWAVAIRIAFDRLTLSRDQLISELKKAGIETRPGFYSASRLDYQPCGPDQCPVADAVSSEIIVLPCSPKLSEASAQWICSVLVRLVDGCARDREWHRIAILERTDADVERVARFAGAIVDGRRSFRYFESRSPAVIRNHVVTLILSSGDKDVGYGHLEREGDFTWLGIAIADNCRGQGWGKILMHALLDQAACRGVREVSLRVDRSNSAGIRLYRQYGFLEFPEAPQGASLLMRKCLSPSRSLALRCEE